LFQLSSVGYRPVARRADCLSLTNGYVSRLDIYVGPETPNPLHITMLRSKHAKPAMRTVIEDIVGDMNQL
jgi:hypothetical protein